MIVLVTFLSLLVLEGAAQNWGPVLDIKYQRQGIISEIQAEDLRAMVRRIYDEPYQLEHKRALLQENLEKRLPKLKFWIVNEMLDCETIDVSYCDRWVAFKIQFGDRGRHYVFVTVMARNRKRNEKSEGEGRDWGSVRNIDYKLKGNDISDSDAYYLGNLVKETFSEPYPLKFKRDHVQAVLEKEHPELKFWIANEMLDCSTINKAYCNRWVGFKMQFENRRQLYHTIMAKPK